jgi:hypothetical protein
VLLYLGVTPPALRRPQLRRPAVHAPR